MKISYISGISKGSVFGKGDFDLLNMNFYFRIFD